MGLLIPEDLPLDKLPSSERRVIRTFQSTLKDSWLIIPEINLIEKDRTYEIDVLLINELQGIAAIEVKGGPFEVRDGEWYRRGDIVSPSPPLQAHDAAFTLRNQLRRHSPLLGGIHVQSAVALPDLHDFEDLADRRRGQTTGEAGVAVGHLLGRLVARERHLLGVDDDDEVTTVDVRGEGRLVLATDERGGLDGQAAQADVGGVDDVPLALDVPRLRAEGTHG